MAPVMGADGRRCFVPITLVATLRLANEREFLRTLVRAQPDWPLLGIPHLAELPAIRWRLQNLEQLSLSDPTRFHALAEALDRRLVT